MAPQSPDRPWQPATTENGAIIAGVPGRQDGGTTLKANPALARLPEPGPIVADKAYTLPELIDIAERNNPATRIAWNEARNAALLAGLVQASFLPILSASAIGGWQSGSTGNNAGNAGLTVNGSVTGALAALSLTWLLYDFGERSNLLEAAKQGSVVANIGFTAAHQKIVGAVSQAYYAVDAAAAHVASATAALRNAEAIQAAAEARYARGIGTVVESAQARQAAAQAQLALVQAQGAEKDARLALLAAMGISPLTALRIAPLPQGALPKHLKAIADAAISAALSRRPDLQAAYAAMLDHADQHIARLVKFLEESGQLDDTMIVLMSDNGASPEGGPFGMVNAMGPYNLRREPIEEKIARIDDIGGPDTHSNFPLGWAMASNTPLRRYKQNTHGGGIRDPLVISWPKGLSARGELRHQFCHASDLVPTLLDVVGVKPPAAVNGVAQMPLEGTSFAASLKDAKVPSKAAPQYFEMFGHRGLVKDGWKAVAFHPLGSEFEKDKWELFHLDRDFSETDDLADKEPAKLKALIDLWWKEAEAHNVLPLDDRFQARFADNAKRFHGPRNKFVFHAGMGHVPTDVAPDVRSRTYTIEADVQIAGATTEGVLIAHGDMTCGYSLYIKDNRLTYDMNIGGVHHIAVSDRAVPAGNRLLGLRMRREKGRNLATLLIDGQPAGGFDEQVGFVSFISWSGLDIGRDRSSPVSHYEAPFAFTGKLRKVTFVLDDDQALDAKAAAAATLARE